MRDFKTERKEKKADRRKLTARIQRLTRFIIWHYLLLGFACVSLLLSLFAMLNTDAPWKGAMLTLISASLVLGLYLLLSGLSK